MAGTPVRDGIRPLPNAYYPLLTYTIVNDIAYRLGDEAIILDNITRITNKPSVEYDGETISLFVLYTFDTVIAIIDQEGYDSISGDLSLTEVPSYTINSNQAIPVEGTGTDTISISSVNKVRQLPDISLDGTPTTMYMCLDILSNVIVYTDIIGYQAITGLAYSEYSVSSESYRSNDAACGAAASMSLYSSSGTIVRGVILYTDPYLTVPYESGSYVYIESASQQLSITTNVSGEVLTVYNCVIPTPTPSPTPTPTPTPTP